MTYDQFILDHLGEPWEVVDPNAYAQCFDLAVGYCDILGIPRVFPFVNAYEIYTKFGAEQAKYFDRVENTPTAVPPEGAIVVFKSSYNNGPGHVCLAMKYADLDTFVAFSQNDPKYNTCLVTSYDYSKVHGWLIPKKKLNTNNEQPIPTTSTAPEVAKYNSFTQSLRKLNDAGRYTFYTDDPGRIVEDLIQREKDLKNVTDERDRKINDNKQLEKNITKLTEKYDYLETHPIVQVIKEEVEIEKKPKNKWLLIIYQWLFFIDKYIS